MPSPRRQSIVLVSIALVLIHLWIKTHIVRMRAIPLGTDPCDAVNIIGFAVVIVAAVWGIVRLIRPSHDQEHNTWRTVEAVLLALFMTVAAELITLLRNLALLHPQQRIILSFLALEAFALLAAQAWLLSSRTVHAHRTRYLAITVTVLAPLLALVLSPEWPIDGDTLLRHLLTVLVGFLVLLLPVHSIPMLLTNQRPGLRSTQERLMLGLGFALVLTGFWRLGHGANPRMAFLLNFAGCLAMTVAALSRPLGIVSARRV